MFHSDALAKLVMDSPLTSLILEEKDLVDYPAYGHKA